MTMDLWRKLVFGIAGALIIVGASVAVWSAVDLNWIGRNWAWILLVCGVLIAAGGYIPTILRNRGKRRELLEELLKPDLTIEERKELAEIGELTRPAFLRPTFWFSVVSGAVALISLSYQFNVAELRERQANIRAEQASLDVANSQKTLEESKNNLEEQEKQRKLAEELEGTATEKFALSVALTAIEERKAENARNQLVQVQSQLTQLMLGAPPELVAKLKALEGSVRLAKESIPAYYASVDFTKSETLRTSLHEIIDDHVRYPYTLSTTDTYDILDRADQDPTKAGNILDLYRNTSVPKHGGGNAFYNREHTWPKSYGFPNDSLSNYPYTDCHHLFLCDSSYNSSRSIKPYRSETVSSNEMPTEENGGVGGGSGTYPGNSNWTSTDGWETWIGRRGDVARALLYLDVRYEGGTHGVTGGAEPDLVLTNSIDLITDSITGNNESIAYMGLLSTLLDWHEQDPVDDMERDRNDVVYAFQGNRNPFIDHPD